MRLVKFMLAVSLTVTTCVNAASFKIMDDAPVYWQERDALSQHLVKSGKCMVLSRIGDDVTAYAHEVKIIRDETRDDRTREYIPYMTYSCMISGDPLYAGYIPEHYLKML